MAKSTNRAAVGASVISAPTAGPAHRPRSGARPGPAPWGSRRVVCAPLRRLTPANPASRITRATRLARLPTASWISPPHRGQVSTTAALLHPSGVAGAAASLSDTWRDSPSLHLECVGSCTADGPALSAARACPETPHGRPGADNRSRRRRRSRSVKRHRLRRRRGLGSRRSAERASQGRVVEQAARLRVPTERAMAAWSRGRRCERMSCDSYRTEGGHRRRCATDGAILVRMRSRPSPGAA